MQLARCFPKARSVPYLLGIVFRLMSDSSPMGSQTPSPIGKCPLLQVNSQKIHSCQSGQIKLHKSYWKIFAKKNIPKVGLAQGLHAPVNTRMGDLYGVAREYIWNRENIYGRQRECIWNIYGTQATVNSRTRDGSLGSQPWWGNCDDRCGDNNAPVWIIEDWRKEINSPKKRGL